jgi:hypothetical protein
MSPAAAGNRALGIIGHCAFNAQRRGATHLSRRRGSVL